MRVQYRAAAPGIPWLFVEGSGGIPSWSTEPTPFAVNGTDAAGRARRAPAAGMGGRYRRRRWTRWRWKLDWSGWRASRTTSRTLPADRGCSRCVEACHPSLPASRCARSRRSQRRGDRPWEVIALCNPRQQLLASARFCGVFRSLAPSEGNAGGARRRPEGPPRVPSHPCLGNGGTESLSKSGIKWMVGTVK